MKKRMQVALIVPLDLDYMRKVVHGVLQFAASRRWLIHHFPDEDRLWVTLSQWQPTGIIGAVHKPERLAAIRDVDAPYVDVSGERVGDDLPQVASDDVAIGALAAGHLLERGFSNFAYAGSGRHMENDTREAGFRKQLSGSAVGEIPVYRDSGDLSPGRTRLEPTRALYSWIASLPKPCGLLASSDALGRHIVEACNAAGVRVPEDVAVVGCGNDDIICKMSLPSLSSVSLPGERIGYEAAGLLERLMAGGAKPKQPLILPVSSVFIRQSTDVISISDPDVAAAMRFIRAHAGEWIGVREVLLAVSINRRSLERKFRQYVGRSPLEEIRRVRLEIAKDLLSRTDLAMPIVARRAGFSEAKQLSLMFHNEMSMTPTAYRRQFRVASEPQRDEQADEAAV